MITCKNFGIPEKGGRLGNSLFQFCSIIGLAQRFYQPYALPQWKYSHLFNLEFRSGIVSDCQEVREKYFHYDLNQFSSIRGGKNFNIIGYLQSEKYFGKDKLKFRESDMTNDLKYSNTAETIGIHVRRGDYVDHPYYHQLSIDYFLTALHHIPDYENKRILIFSDDIEWCKNNFPTGFNFAEGNSEIEDLFLLSKCDYHILSNSTFGWWGAYLSDSKIVIRPKHYFAGEGLKHNTKDFWPKNWIEHV